MPPSSTFNSDLEVGPAPDGASPSFFKRGLLLLAVAAVTYLGVSQGAGLAYRSKSLAPDPAQVASSDHFLAIFGNSLFEAAIDSTRLAGQLGKAPGAVRAQMWNGAGWNPLQYYALARLARDRLRPGRDAAIIEVSATSLNDADTRLGTTKPEAVLALARLPSAPTELRLDALASGVSPLYRYRIAFQELLRAQLERRLAARPLRTLVGPPPRTLPFQVVLAPDRNFVIEKVTGDQRAFELVAHERAVKTLANVRVGGFKLAALERAIRTLREHDVAVVLVVTPSADWFERLLPPGVESDFRADLQRLAVRTGAIVLSEWPPALRDARQFWDGHHMVAAATAPFTDELARRIAQSLGW